jgi:hypothetical protein
MAELISRATRRAAREAWVETTLREIESDFDNAGIEQGDLPSGMNITGERRTLVEKYYATIDWSSKRDVRRVLAAYESLLGRLGPYHGERHLEPLIAALRRDGLSYVNGKLVAGVPLEDVRDEVLRVDLSQLKANIDRMRAAVDQDPALAIGSAKELVEATCKAILADAKAEAPSDAKLPQLVTLAAKQLDLLPADVPESAEGSASIRRVLGSLANIVQGLAELRNLYGTGHGKAPGHPMLTARHAKLCAGSASALSTFLMETASEKRGT